MNGSEECISKYSSDKRGEHARRRRVGGVAMNCLRQDTDEEKGRGMNGFLNTVAPERGLQELMAYRCADDPWTLMMETKMMTLTTEVVKKPALLCTQLHLPPTVWYRTNSASQGITGISLTVSGKPSKSEHHQNIEHGTRHRVGKS